MPKWIRAASVADCPPGHAIEVVVDSRVIAIVNVAGQFHALDGICPHQGGPLGKGTTAAGVLTCPWHGWQFDVRTGRHLLSSQLAQERFPLRVEDDTILVDVGSPG